KILIIDHVVTDKHTILLHSKLDEILSASVTAGEGRTHERYNAPFDSLLGPIPSRVDRIRVGHDQYWRIVFQTPLQGDQGDVAAPTWNRDDIGSRIRECASSRHPESPRRNMVTPPAFKEGNPSEVGPAIDPFPGIINRRRFAFYCSEREFACRRLQSG